MAMLMGRGETNVDASNSSSSSRIRADVPDSYWLATNILHRHVTTNSVLPTMLAVPEELYIRRKSSVECPLHFYVYRNEDIHLDYTTTNEEMGLNIFFDGTEENFNLDIYLMRLLFRTSPCRVLDPNEASVFIVPYLHATHCLLHEGYGLNCKQVPDWKIDTILSNLTHFNRVNHVFLLGWGTHMSNIKLQRMPLTLTVGPTTQRIKQGRKRVRRGESILNAPTATLVPMVNGHARFQLEQRRLESSSSNRTYAMSYFYGATNSKMKGKKNYRRFRSYFAAEFQDGQSVGGRPIRVQQLNASSPNMMSYEDFYDAYEDSIFCPIMAGDISWQQRFYDVLLCGCIPVVLEWNNTNGERSWHAPGESLATVGETYPFFATGNDGNNFELDYDLFVVRIPGNTTDESNMSVMRSTLERLLSKNPATIQRMQQSLRRSIPYLSYNLGLRAHTSEDAFYRILKVLAKNARLAAARARH